MIDIGLVLSRLLHYAAVTTLAGASFFPLYAYAAAEPKGYFAGGEPAVTGNDL